MDGSGHGRRARSRLGRPDRVGSERGAAYRVPQALTPVVKARL